MMYFERNENFCRTVSSQPRIFSLSLLFVTGFFLVSSSSLFSVTEAFCPHVTSTRRSPVVAVVQPLSAKKPTKVLDAEIVSSPQASVQEASDDESSTSPIRDNFNNLRASLFANQQAIQEDQVLLLEEQDDNDDNDNNDSLNHQLSDADIRNKYLILGLLWITTCLAALDRVAMSVALVPMSAEFGWTSTVKGSISSVFSLGYGIFILPAGLLVGNLSPRNVMVFGIALWSVATLLTPVAASSSSAGGSAAAAAATLVTTGVTMMLPLFVARACVGAGESILIPSTQRFLSVWTSPEEKSRALAFVLSGFAFGKIGAYLLSPLIMETVGGWRELFFTYGTFGALLCLPWLLWAKDEPSPPSNQKLDVAGSSSLSSSTDAAVAGVVEETKQQTSTVDEAIRLVKEAPWKEMAQSRGVWAMLLAHCAKNWGLYNWLTWTPTFYAEHYNLSVKDSAWLSVLPGVAGIVGGAVAGLAADAVVRNMKDENDAEEKTRIRNAFQAVGLLGPAAAVGTLAWHIPEHAWVAQISLAAAFGLMGFNTGGFEAANQEKAGSRWAGLLYSVTSLPGVMVGTGGVYLTGRILDATNQDWSVVFGINAVVNVLGAAAFIALYDSKREFE